MATINDVAARAGVSVSTVSRWLSGQVIRNAEAVQAAVEELGFRPNAMAQSLKSGRRGAIGVVVPDITNPFFAAAVKGLEQASRELNYRLLLANSDESNEREAEIIADLTGRVDGFILAPAHEQDRAPLRLHEAGAPAVLLDREVEGGELFDVVIVDNINGAASAARHLIDLGHTAIAMINGPTDTTPGRERREGFLGALADAGLELAPEYDLTGDFREASGRSLTLQLLSLPEPPTAIFTGNNLMTAGALTALRDMRVRVPATVSIVGFDDLSLGALLQPPLTCVSRPEVEQGALAMRLLLSRIADHSEDPPRRVVLDTKLVVRGSTAAPREPAVGHAGRPQSSIRTDLK
jgi:DNA-binding LacI/PurR family transcriptional regulator